MVTNETIYLDEAEVTAGTQPYLCETQVVLNKEHLFPMKTLKDIHYVPDSLFYSLASLVGSPIIDAKIDFSRERGDVMITVYALVLADGRTLSLQGEHDIVYIEDEVVPQGQLDLFYEEENAEL